MMIISCSYLLYTEGENNDMAKKFMLLQADNTMHHLHPRYRLLTIQDEIAIGTDHLITS